MRNHVYLLTGMQWIRIATSDLIPGFSTYVFINGGDEVRQAWSCVSVFLKL